MDVQKLSGMEYTLWTKKAMEICFLAHKDQRDVGGMPYVFHPFHLAEQMETEEEICTALLHDVLEDSSYTMESLKSMGFRQEILDAVALLSHTDGMPYMEYVCALRKNPIARKVKKADLLHNCDTNRLNVIRDWDKKRLRKYRIALAVLEEDPFDESMKSFRKRIPLDEKKLCFLSVFYRQDGRVIRYCLELALAAPEDGAFGSRRITFDEQDGERLAEALEPACSLPEGLADFIALHQEPELIRLLEELGIL